jgi:hypothetical protein
MNTIDFIRERREFMPLWERAIAGVGTLRDKTPTELLYFDTVDLQTQKFFELIQELLAFKGTTEFATLVLKPDPFDYFNFHFGKYPGFRHRAGVYQEIWGALIAYNIRREMACAAWEAKRAPTDISFVRAFHTIQHEMMWAAVTPAYAKLPACLKRLRERLKRLTNEKHR